VTSTIVANARYLRQERVDYISPPVCLDAALAGDPTVVIPPWSALSAPTGLIWTVDGTTITFRWDDYTGVVCASIYRVTNPGEPDELVELVSECAPINEEGDVELPQPEEEEECYAVSVLTAGGYSELSDAVCVPPTGGGDNPVIVTSDIPVGRYGDPYSHTFTIEQADGDPLPEGSIIVWGDVTLPDGFPGNVTFSNGVVSGTPSWVGDPPTEPFVGVVTVEVSVTSGNNTFLVEQDVTFTFNPPLTIATDSSLPDAAPDDAYSVGLTTANSVGGVVWSLAEGSDPLPDWLSLNPTTGVLSGTPEEGDEGTFTFTIQAEDEQ
jgi:hypothetical protein